jgi:hypothetical protein
MSVFVRTLNGGTNGYNTPASDASWIFNINNRQGIFVSTDYAVTQHTGSDLNVVVNAGNILMSATPTSESARIFGVNLTDNAVVSIPSNTSGSTKYDVVYLSLSAATLHNPPSNGDFVDASSLLIEQHTVAGQALSATNGIALAEVAVANNATAITNSNITDKRYYNGYNTALLATAQSNSSLSPTFTTFYTYTNLSMSIIAPGGRPVKVRIFLNISTSANCNVTGSILDNGSFISSCGLSLADAPYSDGLILEYTYTPVAGAHVYNFSCAVQNNGATGTVFATGGDPIYGTVEYV